MIDTIVKLWPVITGTAVGGWVAFQWAYKRWTRTRSIEAAKKAKADELAEQALEAARAQTDAARAASDAAIAAHMRTLEATLTKQADEILRLDSALEVSHQSEVEAWKRYNAEKDSQSTPDGSAEHRR